MQRQLNLLVHLVDDLLDVSRISSGKSQLRRAAVNLRKVLDESAQASSSILDARRHQLKVDTGSEELTVDGDFDRLIQVFSNLLSNAAKYTTAAGTIELRARREGERGRRHADGQRQPPRSPSHLVRLDSIGS